MNFYPLTYCRHFIRRAITDAKKVLGRKTVAIGFSSYRYDSTGRIVHYGPAGEVLEYESTFQITGVKYKQVAGALSKK